jgi:WhiB family redox-sensing transcriptional regulator
MEGTDAGVRIVLAETHRPSCTGLSVGTAGDRWPGQADPGRPGGRELTAVDFSINSDTDFGDGPAEPAHPDGAVAAELCDRESVNVLSYGLGDIFADPPEWQERALCAQTDPEAFFPEKGGSTREAKRICSGCEVRDECLEYALEKDERFGIWGGMSERERRRLRRRAV